MAITFAHGESKTKNFSLTARTEISILSPLGGEEFKAGQTYNILWQAHGVDQVTIYSRRWVNGGYITGRIHPENAIPSEPGIYSWPIPIDIEPGKYKIRLNAIKNGSFVGFAESDFLDIVPSSIGKYTAGVLYMYPNNYEGDSDPGNWRDDWYDYTLEISRFHLDLWENFIKHHGLPANIDIINLDKRPVNTEPHVGTSFYTLLSAYKSYPGWNVPIKRIGYFVQNINADGGASPQNQLVVAKISVDSMGMRSMKGEFNPDNKWCRSQLCHELGHNFGVLPGLPHVSSNGHCYSPEGTCIMSLSLPNISYNEWIARGQILWFCDDCRNVILDGWAKGKFL